MRIVSSDLIQQFLEKNKSVLTTSQVMSKTKPEEATEISSVMLILSTLIAQTYMRFTSTD